MLKRTQICLCFAVLALSACTTARDPGYICMTNCAHECGDGMQGDSCRALQQQQDKDRDSQDKQND